MVAAVRIGQEALGAFRRPLDVAVELLGGPGQEGGACFIQGDHGRQQFVALEQAAADGAGFLAAAARVQPRDVGAADFDIQRLNGEIVAGTYLGIGFGVFCNGRD